MQRVKRAKLTHTYTQSHSCSHLKFVLNWSSFSTFFGLQTISFSLSPSSSPSFLCTYFAIIKCYLFYTKCFWCCHIESTSQEIEHRREHERDSEREGEREGWRYWSFSAVFCCCVSARLWCASVINCVHLPGELDWIHFHMKLAQMTIIKLA